MRHSLPRIAMLAAVALATATASAQLTNYSQDFESLDRNDFNALSNDGWQTFASGLNGSGAFPNFGAGPFATPNDISNPFQAVISESMGGDPPAGSQGLVILSDYGADPHQNPADPRDLELSIFQEQTITAGDIGSSVTFSFLADGNVAPPTGDAIAEAFLITLDPNAGFSRTNNLSFDTTNVADGALINGSLSLDITDPLLQGQILQFGFRSIASDFEGSAVDYDNINFTIGSPPPAPVGLQGYFQDFESLDRNNFNALSDDGWQTFAAGTNGAGGFPDFTAGPFPTPNDINNPFQAVISESMGGDPPAGDQGLVILSDYDSDLHQNPSDPRDLTLSIFQEQTIESSDLGGRAIFAFLADGNAAPPTGDATAEAFLLTLDASFNATNNLAFDTTNIADGAAGNGLFNGSLTLDLTDLALVGQTIQYGFRNTASDFEGSAVDYDNVLFFVDANPDFFEGDFNGDLVVDAADYTVWRDSVGSASPQALTVDALGNSDGVVDEIDYFIWALNFGNDYTVSSVGVPEPSTLAIALVAAVGVARRGRR